MADDISKPDVYTSQLAENAALQKGISYHQAGQLDKAIDCYQKTIEIQPENISALSNLGIAFHDQGQLDAAVICYQKAISIKPNLVETHSNLAITLQSQGKLEEAVASLQKAISIKPDYAEAHSNLGNVLKDLGKLETAVISFQKAISIKPDYAEAHCNLGNVLKNQGKLEEAVASFQKATSIKSNLVEAHNNLGLALQEQGKLQEAVASFQKAISIKPDLVEPHNNLGITLHSQWKLDAAVASFQKAISIKPDYAAAHSNLGNAFRDQGELKTAIASYQKALSIKPDFPEAHYNFGNCLLMVGETIAAFHHYRNAIKIDQTNSQFWSGYAKCLEMISFTSYQQEYSQELLYMLEQPTVLQTRVAKSIMSHLHHHPTLKQIAEYISTNSLRQNISCTIRKLSNIQLLLNLLEMTTINDAVLEQILTQTRATILQELLDQKSEEPIQRFHAALAIHCFNNEYIFFETAKEKQQINELQQLIITLQKNNQSIPSLWIAILGCYIPLHTTSFAEILLESEWPADIVKVLGRQIIEPREEQALRQQIHRIASIQNTITENVQYQYEENPYPVWNKPGISAQPREVKQVLRDILFKFANIDGEISKEPKILIAGCGTGQQAIQAASRFKDSHLTAVDLSLSSLSYAKRKTQTFDSLDINYIQCDIYNLKKLGEEFDVIECRGVLHHLADPMEGWKILVDILRPNGLMKIGLYSKIARSGIIKTWEMIKERGYSPTPDDIRQCRQEIMNMTPDMDQDIYRNINSVDFYSMSGCRDLIFHAQETQFTLLEIDEALQTLGLRFLGFEFHDMSAINKFCELYPEKKLLQSLTQWHDFEEKNTNTFSRMYEFWVQKR
ncbi:MAG: tetratricopeptide repeat protein [Magnetococcales bacterium]|nr:tetratricopeptide repeat protein [Magnetococcales bacterium]